MTTGRRERVAERRMQLKAREIEAFSHTPAGELAGCAGSCTDCPQWRACRTYDEYMELVLDYIDYIEPVGPKR